MPKTEEQKAREVYEKQERLIEKNRHKPAKVLNQVIRWVYRSKINNSVYCMNADGVDIPTYAGKFADQGARILQDAPPEAEFYISYSGGMNFVTVSREQWEKQ